MDGFSHVPVFLHCSNNNRASTGLEHFQNAVVEWELASRVRYSRDKGGENTEVAWFLLSHPCKKRYRKRISHSRERCPQSEYRKIVARCVQRSAKDLFYHMEDMDLLDPENDCLLFVGIAYSSHK